MMISKQKAALVKFELLKLVNKITLFCIIFFITIITRRIIFFNSNDFYTINYFDENGTQKHAEGEQAFEIQKSLSNKHKGELNDKKFEQALIYYKELVKQFDLMGELAWQKEYDGIFSVFEQAFAPPEEKNYYITGTLHTNDMQYIYKNRIYQLEESMSSPKNKIHASKKVIEAAEKIKTPFYYDGNYDSWRGLIQGSKKYLLYFFLIIIICSSFIFYNETIFSSCIHFSIPTLNGRKEHALSKITALIICGTLIYLFTVGLYISFILLERGTDGANTQIQIMYFYSLYNGTVKDAVIHYFLIIYFAGLFFALFTFFVSLYVKNIVTTIMLSAGFLFLGGYIPEGSIFERLIFLFPGSVLSIKNIISRPIVYNLFGRPVLLAHMYIPSCIILSIVLAVLIVKKYKKMEF